LVVKQTSKQTKHPIAVMFFVKTHPTAVMFCVKKHPIAVKAEGFVCFAFLKRAEPALPDATVTALHKQECPVAHHRGTPAH
jgi:hypothetical protein